MHEQGVIWSPKITEITDMEIIDREIADMEIIDMEMRVHDTYTHL